MEEITYESPEINHKRKVYLLILERKNSVKSQRGSTVINPRKKSQL